MTSLTNMRMLIGRMCSAIVEALAYVFLLIGASVGLWDGKNLKETIAWRKRLEIGVHSLPEIDDDWSRHGLPFPNSMKMVEAELAKTIKREDDLRRQRKILATILLILGTALLILSKLPALGINL